MKCWISITYMKKKYFVFAKGANIPSRWEKHLVVTFFTRLLLVVTDYVFEFTIINALPPFIPHPRFIPILKLESEFIEWRLPLDF